MDDRIIETLLAMNNEELDAYGAFLQSIFRPDITQDELDDLICQYLHI